MIFPQIIYQIVPYKFLFWKPLLPATEKCTVKEGAWKCTSGVIIGIRLACHFSQTSTVTYLFYCIFRNRFWQGTFKERLKKTCYLTSFFSNESPRKILTAVNIYFSQSDYSVWLLSIFSRHSLIIIQITDHLCIIVKKSCKAFAILGVWYMYKPSYFERWVRQLSLETCWPPCSIKEKAGQRKCSAFCPLAFKWD